MTDYRPCADCARPMRTSRQRPAANHPGTVQYAAKGLCVNCDDKKRRTKKANPEAISEDFNLPHAIAAYNGWIADRNRRLGVSA